MIDEASTTTWETLVEQYRERAARDDARIDELRQSTEHWHDTAEMLMRQRNTAEVELDIWKTRAKTVEEQREAARDEADRWKGKWVVAEQDRKLLRKNMDDLIVNVNAAMAEREAALQAELLLLLEQLRHQSHTLAALQEPSTSVLIAMQSADSHGDVTDAQCIEMLRAALTAALAVQPTTGEEA
jgi:hypothetical protein